MSLSRVLYRIRQFYLALWAAADPRDLEQARAVLTPAQVALFTGMQSGEQAHAVSVYRQLVAQGETSSDLLAAALMHDVGKSLSPLRLWERVLIVLARAFFPAQSRRWGSLPAEGLRGSRPPSPESSFARSPSPLTGYGENIKNLGVLGSRAAQNTQISGFSPRSLPVSGGEKEGNAAELRSGDERGNLSIPEEAIRGWRRTFIVAEQHPAWGAALAAEAGASPRLVTLIRLHQEVPPTEADPETRRLLSKLQAVDDNN